jgi:hypothetical protein
MVKESIQLDFSELSTTKRTAGGLRTPKRKIKSELPSSFNLGQLLSLSEKKLQILSDCIRKAASACQPDDVALKSY